MRVKVIPKCSWCVWNGPQRVGEGSERIKNQWKKQDHPDYYISEIGQNTEKSPGNLRRSAIT